MEKRIDIINRPRIVSVLSGKGGVGKSVVTYNLAVATTQLGYRSLIIDCDWYFGDIHILANVVPKANLADIITKARHTSDAIVRISDNLHLLPSPATPTTEPRLHHAEIERFLKNIKTYFADYDFILIDTPSSLLGTISLCAEISDLNLILINPELTSLADGYGLFKYLVASGFKNRSYLLANRIETGTEYEYVYRKFSALAERFLEKWPYEGGYIVESEDVRESVEKQKSLFEMAADSEAAAQFLELCNLLTENVSEAAEVSQSEVERSINS
jgi:flagellar biosynthesis protein FlhG